MTAIRILLVDDHAIVREGYRALLAKQTDLAVVAEAGDAEQAYRQFKQHRPDLVLTDISLPGGSGLELIRRIKQHSGNAAILVFSMHQNPEFALRALRAGALGYVTKSSEPGVLLHALREVFAGRHALSADMAQILALEKLGKQQLALETLTPREFEILRLLVAGKSHADIAGMLNISVKTAGNSHYLIKSKLGVNSDIELTKLAIQLHVLELLA
ncbi:response regulator transcription factor [Methylomonas sp. SURF-2]|uniref:Response regulator transcription factor n=1 Tax=Methylomonas subterranea TaxID=2952225 RepID=A0ABT1TDE2_9GAMM|nr:response regulator transcription factor [Methylomonas sp. SURF-2]MCQ8102799.1 response regulator transcription factor [Methylomonas sp. SURF-2]